MINVGRKFPILWALFRGTDEAGVGTIIEIIKGRKNSCYDKSVTIMTLNYYW